MKHIYIIAICLVSNFCLAQTKQFESFSNDTPPHILEYFESDANVDGKLYLFVKSDKYSNISMEEKIQIFSYLRPEIIGTFIVQNGYIRELWMREQYPKVPTLLNTWDMNNLNGDKLLPVSRTRFSKHPWFFYIGGQYSYGLEEMSAYLNIRTGFYLLANIWDLALTYNFGWGYSENYDYYSDYYNYNDFMISEVGLSTRIYAPIRKIGLSPYVGAGFTCRTEIFEEETTFHVPISFGFSWFIKNGSIDIGAQWALNQGWSATFGYTLRLARKK